MNESRMSFRTLRIMWIFFICIGMLVAGFSGWMIEDRASAEPPGSAAPNDGVNGRLVVPGDFEISSKLPVDVSDSTPDFGMLHNPKRIPESQRIFDRFA